MNIFFRIKATFILFFLSVMMLLQGCNIGVNYRSNPPGAFLTYSAATDTVLTKGTGSGYAPLDVFYAQTDAYRAGGCMAVNTPSAVWPDGASLPSQTIEACKSNAGGSSFLWSYTLTSPSLNKQIIQPTTPPYKPAPSQSIDLNQAKNKCNELGFKMGTEAFGNCVLRMSK